MAYVIDRRRAVSLRDLIAIVRHRQRGARSRVVLSDNSLYHTLTRPRTLARYIRAAAGVVVIGARGRRTA